MLPRASPVRKGRPLKGVCVDWQGVEYCGRQGDFQHPTLPLLALSEWIVCRVIAVDLSDFAAGRVLQLR